MKAMVDKETCISCGLCASICPEVFSIDTDGKYLAISTTIDCSYESSTAEAADSCPVDAIHTNNQ